MKLHTNFHDYYDKAVGYGIDDNVHYNRFTKEVEINIKPRADFPSSGIESYLLGFCGKIYPVIKLEKSSISIYSCEYEYGDYEIVETYYAYSFEDADYKHSEWDKFCENFTYSNDREKIELKQFFIDWSFQDDEVFLEHKTPAWVVKLDRNRKTGLINPKLKDYGFDQIKDSFTAFQEISMYFSNILIERKETIVFDDKSKIKQHGFDLKKSFRKEKKQ